MFKYIGLSTIFSVFFSFIFCLITMPEGDIFSSYVFNSIFFGVIIGLLVSIYKRLPKDAPKPDKVKAAYDNYLKE